MGNIPRSSAARGKQQRRRRRRRKRVQGQAREGETEEQVGLAESNQDTLKMTSSYHRCNSWMHIINYNQHSQLTHAQPGKKAILDLQGEGR